MANEFKIKHGFISTGDGSVEGSLTITGAAYADNGSRIASRPWVTQFLSDNSYATSSDITTAISNLVDSAPGTLDTLNELAAALGDDPNFSTTLTNSIATKLPLAGGTMSGDIRWTSTGKGLEWVMNTDGAGIKFYNTGDADTNSRLEYYTTDNGTEYHRFMVATNEEMTIKSDGVRVTNNIYMASNLVATQSWVSTRGYGAASDIDAVNTRIDEEVLPAIPTNNNQLTNGAGYITDGNSGWNNSYGFITGSDSITGNADSATSVVTLQDTAPDGVNGKLWWETDTGTLKVYYGDSSAWIDALPLPDTSLFYTRSGGAIDGDVYIGQILTVEGNITTSSSFVGPLNGNASTATQLATARNIALTGAVTGNANFDGSGNISISTTATSDPTLTINGDASGSATFTNLGNATLTLTISDDSHNHTIANVDGLQTALDGKQAAGSYLTSLPSHNHDDRYYTESESDTRFASRGFLNAAYVDFTVNGDADTFYPVRIGGSGGYGFQMYSISRGYSWTAPSTWNTATHKGGLTLTIQWSGDTAWGGNDKALRVIQFDETYSTVAGGMALPVTGGLMVWLRGGGATYRCHSPKGVEASVTVELTGFEAANGTIYEPRSLEEAQAGQSSITTNWPVRDYNQLYDTGNRVATQTWVGTQGYLTSLPSHNHNDIYYTETEVNTLLASKLSTTAKAADSELLDGINSTQFVRSDQNSVTIGRHLDANTTWSNSAITLFLGWYGDKIVVGNNNDGGHDYANALGGNTIPIINKSYFYKTAKFEEDIQIDGNVNFLGGVGTWISSNVMTDSIGWNTNYGVYIGSNVGGTHYLRGNGTFTTGGSTYNLWHAGNFDPATKEAAGSADTVNTRIDEEILPLIDGKLASGGKAADSELLDGIDSSAFIRENQDRRHKVIRFTGESGDSGNGVINYGIYQEGGAWVHPYPDLVIGMHTGIKIGGYKGYGGTRFYSDAPGRSGAIELLSVGNGDNHIRVSNNLIVTGTISGSGYNDANWNTAYGWGNHASGGYSTASGVEDNANNYVHPTTAGNKHIPSGGSAGQFLKYSSSGTAVWAADNNTTYSVGDGGLTEKNFTTTLKTKLDGIAASANNYSLPVASSSIGGVKSGTDISVDGSGNVSVNNDSHTHDGRYYTESESDARFVNVTGDTITGDLAISGATLSVTSTAEGTEAFFVDGVNGRLFTISDDLSDSLFSANTISGLPVIEAFADNTVKLGPYSNPVVIDSTGSLTIGGATAATESYVNTSISNLIGGAPGALDTLNELAAAINDDASYASTVTTALGTKAPLASPALTGTPTAPTAATATNTTQIATTAFVKAQGYVTTDTNTNYYLDDITKSGNTLTYVMNGKTDLTYTFGSNAFTSYGNHVGLYVDAKNRTNYKGVTDDYVIGQMMWKNYGNNHTIFDASNSTTPGGTACSNSTPEVEWTGTYPTLMGWNGSSTYGVRVDSAGRADNSNLLDGLDLHTGRNNEVNKVVRTDASGYIQAGWINTTSGDRGVVAPTRIYASNDDYIRYYTPANFLSVLELATTSNIKDNAVVTIQDAAPTGVDGRLWWESDTGKLKVYYGSSSAWIDAVPIPDVSIYYPKSGGAITGDVLIEQTLTVVGNTLIEGTLTETSDINLKENIAPLENALGKVISLEGVSFNKKDTPEVKEIGFIAQQVEEIVPELVTETESGIKTVSYTRVSALLVETVKEQQKEIDSLKALVADLANKINNL